MEIKRSEAKEILKAYLPEYLKMEGFSINRGNASPCCGGGRITRNSFHYNHKNNTVKCFSCGFTGDIFDFVKMQYGLKTYNETLDKTAELLGFTIVNEYTKENEGLNLSKHLQKVKECISSEEKEGTDYSEYIKTAASNNNYKYLEERGISREVQKRFMVGYDPEWRNPVTLNRWDQEGRDVSKLPKSPRCIIPNGRFSYLARDTRRNLLKSQKKYSKQVAGPKQLYNKAALMKDDVIFVVEGEIDALSVIEAGFEAIGLCGAWNSKKLIEELKRGYENKKIIIMLDPDETGRKNSEYLSKTLKSMRIPYVDATKYIDMQRDPNAQLMHNRQEFIKKLTQLYKLISRSKKIELNTRIITAGEQLKKRPVKREERQAVR